MTKSVPDSISADLLKDLAEKAKVKEIEEKIEQKKEEGPHGGLTDDQVMDLANKKLDELYEECSSPLVHKVAAMQVIHNLMRWHMNMSDSQAEDGEFRSARAWAADAGRLKVALDALRSISLYPEDFTWRADEGFPLFPEDGEED